MIIDSKITPKEFIDFTKENSKYNTTNINFSTLETIIKKAISQGIGKVYRIKDNNNQNAVAFFIKNNNRWIYLSGTSNSTGQDKRSMFLIINTFLKTLNSTGIYLDFEGSMIEGVARFYEGFGATNENYYHLRINKLPSAVKMIMRNK